MILSQVSTDQIASAFGWPAAIVIVALVGALVFTVRLLLKSYDKIDAIQEIRIVDARETRDKLMEPLQQQAKLTQQIYDILIRNQGQ